jgi:hypothetical protein
MPGFSPCLSGLCGESLRTDTPSAGGAFGTLAGGAAVSLALSTGCSRRHSGIRINCGETHRATACIPQITRQRTDQETGVENIRSPRSGRQHKVSHPSRAARLGTPPWGGAKRNPRNRCRNFSKPAERPIVESSRLTFGNCDRCRPLRGLNCFWRL